MIQCLGSTQTASYLLTTSCFDALSCIDLGGMHVNLTEILVTTSVMQYSYVAQAICTSNAPQTMKDVRDAQHTKYS